MKEDEVLNFIKEEIQDVVKLLPYETDVEVKPTDKNNEAEVIFIYKEPVRKIRIECEVKDDK